ncbi:MAG: proline--tRNA ligase [Candidatus Neptunochlamydia sp.]|nr:proline--tRNA ligase [Candidatus Neptunochlamydia sp.]
MKPKTVVTPTRAEDYSEWYQQVIKLAELAEHSPVRGCMVIKPWGYALWENIQQYLDRRFKETGHQNAYFPLFIPLSYLEKEARHVEGFAKECAVVTHHRLVEKEGKLVPDGELEEPLVVRPTSEMIIGDMFSKWIESYRDLPLLINQWVNVVRWEMRTRLFLRTTEFLWQEGHTAHATEEEARAETRQMLDIYVEFAEKILAMPVIKGEKSENERFPGAVTTYCFEGMMQDGKALQAGTSHFLGQNFSKAQDIIYQDQEGNQAYAWTTSWGVTTRLIGGMIMVHGDDDGLVLPPRIASAQVVILPLFHKIEAKEKILSYCKDLQQKLQKIVYHDKPMTVHLDNRDIRSGEKVWGWIKKGVPIRVEVGARELEGGVLSIAKRNKGHKDFEKQSEEELLNSIVTQLDDIQDALYAKARTFRDSHIKEINTKEEFYDFFKNECGFASAHWSGDPAIEEVVQKDLSVTIRCIPIDGEKEEGTCPFTGELSPQRVIFGKSY